KRDWSSDVCSSDLRAMVFHTGVLWRLNELGMLGQLDVVSGASGGAITAGVLAQTWHDLDFRAGHTTRFVDRVVTPIRSLAGVTVDLAALTKGALKPPRTIGEQLPAAAPRRLRGRLARHPAPRR